MRDLRVARGARIAVENISFQLSPGEFVGLLGENGAGKSTVLEAICGLQSNSSGSSLSFGRPSAAAFDARRIGVVWQHLGLCDNLTAAQNVFLGREAGRPLLERRRMRRATLDALAHLNAAEIDPNRVVSELSGGQRQIIAIARALLSDPPLILLDEPTSALSPRETEYVLGLLRGLCEQGRAVLLVTHQVDEIMRTADRLIVMRQGRMVAVSSPVGLQPGDVLELMSGVAVESVARQNLSQLSSLLEQMAASKPFASLPAIVSGYAAAADQRQLSVHLKDDQKGVLTLAASVSLPRGLRSQLGAFPLARDNAIAEAARTGHPQVVEDLSSAGGFDPVAGGPMSMWAVPIQGNGHLFGVLSGFADVPGRPRDDQLQLAGLYAGLAASAIERDDILRRYQRRNHALEILRELRDVLADPDDLDVQQGFPRVLPTLLDGLSARAVVIAGDDRGAEQLSAESSRFEVKAEAGDPDAAEELVLAAESHEWTPARSRGIIPADEDSLLVPFVARDRRYVLAARWDQPTESLEPETLELLEGAAWSLRLALERTLAEASRAESAAATRTADLQREFIYRLSHELRTPLTAIRGYASSLRSTDVEWDRGSQERFLGAIAAEASRMQRLVGDLLDIAAIESGGMTIRPDWCEVEAVVSAAVAVSSPDPGDTSVEVEPGIPTIWADHDRIEQVLVNLLDNAFKHGRAPISVRVRVAGESVVFDVIDSGSGIPADRSDDVFEPYVRRPASPGAGLGLAICRNIVLAHGGTLSAVAGARTGHVRLTLPLSAAPSTEGEPHV